MKIEIQALTIHFPRGAKDLETRGPSRIATLWEDAAQARQFCRGAREHFPRYFEYEDGAFVPREPVETPPEF